MRVISRGDNNKPMGDYCDANLPPLAVNSIHCDMHVRFRLDILGYNIVLHPPTYLNHHLHGNTLRLKYRIN